MFQPLDFKLSLPNQLSLLISLDVDITVLVPSLLEQLNFRFDLHSQPLDQLDISVDPFSIIMFHTLFIVG
jgi:hypothetical protein